MIEKWRKIIKTVCSSNTFDYCVFEYSHENQINLFIEELQSTFKEILEFGLEKRQTNNITKIWCKMLVFYIVQVKEDECLELMEKKRELYSNRPLEITGQVGLIVRQIAKLCRLSNIYDNNLHLKSQEMFESLQDTINDIFNYCIIGIEMAIEYGIDINNLLKEISYECK